MRQRRPVKTYTTALKNSLTSRWTGQCWVDIHECWGHSWYESRLSTVFGLDCHVMSWTVIVIGIQI